MAGRLQAELNNMLSLVGEWAATLPQKFWDAGVNAVKNFLDALGIHSPGTMQRMMVWEVSEMGRRVPIEGKELVSNIGALGDDVVDSFQPELSLGFDDTLNSKVGATGNGSTGNTFNLNLEIGSVDSEERVREIIDVIQRELTWNNLLAGRNADL